MQIRSLQAHRGMAWWSETWPLMSRSFGAWAGAGFVGIALQLALGSVPILGVLLSEGVRWPFYAGLVFMSREALLGRPVRFEDMFYGFRRAFGEMSILAAVSIFSTLFALGLFAALPAYFLWPELKSAGEMLEQQEWGAAIQTAAPWLGWAFVGANLALVISIVAQFSIPLILFRKMLVGQAMKWTWKGLSANTGAVLLASVMFGVWAIVACLPLFAGLILFIPWSMAVMTKMSSEIFGADTSEGSSGA